MSLVVLSTVTVQGFQNRIRTGYDPVSAVQNGNHRFGNHAAGKRGFCSENAVMKGFGGMRGLARRPLDCEDDTCQEGQTADRCG